MLIDQYSQLRYCRIKRGEKAPFEKEWQKKPYTFEQIKKFLENENYGVLCGYGDLIIIDADEKELQDAVQNQLPDTLRIKTGGGGSHNYFFCKECKNKIVLTSDKHYGEIQSWGSQCVGVGSIHPNGKFYEIENNTDIAEISFDQIMKFIKPFTKQGVDFNLNVNNNGVNNYEDFIQEILPKWKEGDRQELALSVAGYLRKEMKLGANKVREIITEICKRADDQELQMRLRGIVETFKKDEGEVKGYTGLKEKVKINKLQNSVRIFTINGQVESFYETNPFFYDRSGMFWIWDYEKYKYEIADETDILNCISEMGINTINSKAKNEILTALKQFGRKRIPMNNPETWVQFKDKVYDFKTDEIFDATPNYFITNPIYWKIGESDETPEIDKLFIEWVGEKYKQTLYEILAYSCSSDQFMQRLIALVGGGANGKGTFIKFLIKFIHPENICTSELKELSTNQFETSAIYRKLLCVIGEVSYDDLKNTNQLKKLAGEDQIRYCFKGKTPFSEKSIATIISATNSLPKTPDKTIGFYRKWLIVDFPNQFKIKQGVLENIPDQEFNNLAKKVLKILKNLYIKQEFYNEGSFEDRILKYEERSNPLMRFIQTNCNENAGDNIELRVFNNAFNEYAKERHLRIMSVRQTAKILREEGFEMGKRVFDIGAFKTSKQVILNLILNTK